VTKIFEGLQWLGLDWDGEPVFQFARAARHAEAARQLLSAGKAYPCYASPEELAAMREAAKAQGRPMGYDGRWRDRDPKEAPAGVPPVIRLKAPREGETVVADGVQGEVRVANLQLDDMVLLRADGTPTYMLSVVVDDHDMGVTDVIRGDDHLTNTFRQIQLYRALGWEPPRFAHIPLIHGPDGAKLSKRHGALGVEAYRDLGFLPEAMRNYLLRLGWSHGDEEFISTEQAIAWFDLDAVGRSPSRFDMAKLTNLNAHYLRQAEDARLVDLIAPALGASEAVRPRLLAGMAGLKERAKTLVDLAESARVYAERQVPDEKAKKQLEGESLVLLGEFVTQARAQDGWSAAHLENQARALAEVKGVKLGLVAQPLRAAVTGRTVSPPIFEVMAILGAEECMARIAQNTAIAL